MASKLNKVQQASAFATSAFFGVDEAAKQQELTVAQETHETLLTQKTQVTSITQETQIALQAQKTQETEVTQITYSDNATKTQQKDQETEKESINSIPEADHKKVGRPVERQNTYRFSLYLDGDLKDFIKYAAWKSRKSTTQYFNDLVREDMKAYLDNGGKADEWAKIQ